MKQREVHRWVAYVEGGPPHACAVMPWGGDSYFMLGVGGCNYDASTVQSSQHSLKALPTKVPTYIPAYICNNMLSHIIHNEYVGKSCT